MNNYILTSDSHIILTQSLRSYTYNYIKTDNIYLHPYEFKTNDTPLPRGFSEYIYTNNIDNNDLRLILYWKNPNDDGGADGDGAAYWDIKAWGVATITEAVIIGSGSSDSSQLIIGNELTNYNCKLKDETTIEYDNNNQCINYDDIEKSQPTGGTVILCYFYGGLGIAGGGYIHATGSSLLFENNHTFTIKYDNNQITEDSVYPNTSIGTLKKSMVAFNGIKTTHIVDQHPISYMVNSFAIDKFSYNETFKESHTYQLNGTYVYTKGAHIDGDIIHNDGAKTGRYLDAEDCQFSPNFALTNADYDLILNVCHSDTAFYGDGTMENPYRIYFHIEELS